MFNQRVENDEKLIIEGNSGMRIRNLIERYSPSELKRWILTKLGLYSPEKEIEKRYRINSEMKASKYPSALEKWYHWATGNKLDLRNPITFNEKLQWLKIYDATPLETLLADKYLARDWIAEKIGDEYLVPLLGVWDDANDIDFDSLPEKFALKCNHGSGWNIIVEDKNKLDIQKVRKQLNEWLHTNFAFFGFNLHYMNIPPKIIAEKYLESKTGLIDYRFYCFNGEPKQIWVDIFSGTPKHLRCIYDTNWNKLDLQCGWPDGSEYLSDKPANLEKMIYFSRILSKDFSFVRVDFFESEGKLYMGEMTFIPMNGTGAFEPQSWDYKLGEMLKLPEKKPFPQRLF